MDNFKVKKYLLSLIFLSQFLSAQIDFTCRTNKNKLAVDSRLRVEFIVDKEDTDDFQPPSFTNFDVIAGPSTSISTSWVNGKQSYSKTYIYIVSPQKKGVLKITPASIVYKGKKVYSNSVQIQVVDASQIPKNSNDPEYLVSQYVHMVVNVSKVNPYVGEGIYVEYRLYFSNQISINDFNFKQMPKYEGFWNQDIKINQIQVQEGTYNGEPYRYAVLKKSILIPQKSGKLVIEPIKVDLVVGIPTGQADFFGNVITTDVSKTFKTSKRNILVKTLPDKGKPLDFTGAVGDFQMQVTSSKNAVKVNESAQIKIQISGIGNLKLFKLPKIITPAQLEVYTPEHKENVTTRLTKDFKALQGKVWEQYTVVPQSFGKYKIPSVSFSYFNPLTQKYLTIHSKDIVLDIIGSKPVQSNSDAQQIFANTNKKRVKSIESFRYIQTKTTLKKQSTQNFLGTNLFYWLLLCPFLVIPIAILLKYLKEKTSEDTLDNRSKKADKLARKYLSKAKKMLGNKEWFYVALEKALYSYLESKLRLNKSQISREKVKELLNQKNIPQQDIEMFISVLDNCDFARYAPITNFTMEEEYQKAKRIIIKLDKKF